ncbi:MAG: hypothetical protein HRU38_26240 [Saccharospirillaceae bacterium]|nr:hypothetical protein [Saccharospirillaceae bacterium]
MLNTLNCKTAIQLVEVIAKKPATFFASLANVVITAAKDKDVLALSIMHEGASYISELTRRMSGENPQRISLIGGLNYILIDYLDKDVRALLSQPLDEPEMGAVIYAKQQVTLNNKLC